MQSTGCIMNSTSTDCITKQILLRVPRTRVWQALTDAQQFGEWFRVKLENAFAPGAHVRGRVLYPGYEHVPFELTVERMEPERLFSWRWHPYSGDPEADYSTEPSTLVVFELEECEDDTLLTVQESGFDAIPLTRRMEAYRGNEASWAEQMLNIERYIGGAR